MKLSPLRALLLVALVGLGSVLLYAQEAQILTRGITINRGNLSISTGNLSVGGTSNLIGATTFGGATTFSGGIVRTGYSITQAGPGKVGSAAGWVIGAANNINYVATMAASQSAGTFVIPISGLHVGDTITGFTVIAQIESAGGTVTLDGDLRAVTNVAADPTDASIGTITQISVTADTAASQAKTGLTEVVASGKSYYLLITGTTAGSTDIILQHCLITVTQS